MLMDLAAPGTGGLARYEAACRALAEAKAVDEVKEVHAGAAAMMAYARQAKNRQLEIDASEIRLRAERRLGELIGAQKATVGLSKGGRPSETGSQSEPVLRAATLAEAGIDKKLSARAQSYASIPAREFEGLLAERRARIESEAARITLDLFGPAGAHFRTMGTGETEWHTPPEMLQRARDVLGGIDLDPATSTAAQRTVRATSFFTEREDGLSKEWHGRVWLNPPYGHPAIGAFAAKMVEEWKAGRVSAALVLIHNYTDAVWFQHLAGAATAMCFPRGRLRFVAPSGRRAEPTQGQAVFYFGTQVEGFSRAFGSLGLIVARLGVHPRPRSRTSFRADFEVRRIEHAEAKAFIEQWHYSGTCPTGLNIFFGAFLDGELYAVADYGAGVNTDKGAALARSTGLPVRCQIVTQEWLDIPHDSMDVEGLTVGPCNCLELKRLCRQGAKGEAEIPLTRFLAICHRQLKRDGIRFIVSYSDPGELRTERVEDRWVAVQPSLPEGAKQTCGGIYRAANFKHLGLTAPEPHTVREEDGKIVHRRSAYKEMKRWNEKHPEEPKSLAMIRGERGRVSIVTPPKERWFIAL